MKKNLLKTLIAATMMATSMTAMAENTKLTLDDTPASYEAFKSHMNAGGKYDVTYTRTLGGTASEGSKYGTLYLPFKLTSAPEGMKLYYIDNINSTTLTIREVDEYDYSLSACTTLIYELTEAASTLTITSNGATLSSVANPVEKGNLWINGYLTATEFSATEAANCLYMSDDKFVSPTGTFTLQPFRVALIFNQQAAGQTKQPELTITNAASGINGVTLDTPATAITDVYDANGRKQSGLQHGVNIVRHADGSTTKIIVK